MLGVMPTREAQRMADDRGLDLVEITPNAVPPVCKIMDYGKFKYEESIKAKQARKAQKVQKVKEVKFHPGTDTNDFNYKISQIRGFLKDGCKVKLTLQFRGRENAHRELGEDVINRVLEELKSECYIEQAPKTLGRVHGALIGPPRKNGPKPQNAKPAGEGGGIHIRVS
jgi:translation initiation factor IF-3